MVEQVYMRVCICTYTYIYTYLYIYVHIRTQHIGAVYSVREPSWCAYTYMTSLFFLFFFDRSSMRCMETFLVCVHVYDKFFFFFDRISIRCVETFLVCVHVFDKFFMAIKNALANHEVNQKKRRRKKKNCKMKYNTGLRGELTRTCKKKKCQNEI